MRLQSALLASFLGLAAFAPHAMFADTLTAVSVSGNVSGGNNIYPYNMSVNGSSTTVQMICLDINRDVSAGETWQVTDGTIPTDNSQNSQNYRADAWIYSQRANYSASDIQYAIWDIFDPTDTSQNSAFTATAQSLVNQGKAAATNTALINSGFYNGFLLYQPTSDTTGWTYGQPQDFITVNTAATPEPSSLMLLGTGLAGAAGMLRRRLKKA